MATSFYMLAATMKANAQSVKHKKKALTNEGLFFMYTNSLII